MIGMFLGALFAGHIYIIMIITAVQIISFKEVIGIINVPSRARSLRFTKALNWYFLGVAMYFLYGESVIYYFKHIVLVDRILLPFATHHRFISFALYIFGTIEQLPLHPAMSPANIVSRLRLLCRLPPKRPLPLPIHAIRLDAPGALPHRRAIPLRCQQRLRRHDLVLPTRISRHHKRHLRLRLRYHVRSHPAHQDLAQENSRRLRRRMVLHHHLWVWAYQFNDAVQVFYMSRQRPWRKLPHGPGMYSESSVLEAQVYPSLHSTYMDASADNDLHRADATTHSDLQFLCQPRGSLWRLLRLRYQAHVQDQGFR